MSQETSEWLNTRTLIGFTEKRGHAWHYRESDQGTEPNHYPQAVPVDDVLRRLFNFTVDPHPIYVRDGEGGVVDDPDYLEVPNRKAWRCSDNGDVLGIFTDTYQGHQYPDWLLDTVASILDADLGIGSAGLLKNRAQAWVSVEVPDNITTPEGVQFRPHLLACTSFDGSLASTFKRAITNTVCDNTMAAALNERGQEYRVKHTVGSAVRLAEAREALAIVYTLADDFTAEVERLCAWEVNERQFGKHLELIIPCPKDATDVLKSRITKQKDQVLHLYEEDDRVAPWKGTAWGVLQAHNTWWHHVAQVRGDRALRNMGAMVSGEIERRDAEVLEKLLVVTG